MSFTGETYHTDKAGNRLSKSEILDIAWGTIQASMTQRELIEFYIENISIEELIQWASDEHGVFNNK